ncbi:MAG TPA: hypothetical protein VGF86_14835 [Candidatus Tumulicola sp.]|jgi:DNA-binding beta-propeller fold protein YncE
MNARSSVARTILGAAIVFALAACSSASTQGPGGAVPGSSQQAQALRGAILPSGVDTRFGSPFHASLPARPEKKHKVEMDLFVSDAGPTVQILKNKTYQNVGSLTGFGDSDGVWVDKSGNLYVADVVNKDVVEYAPHQTSPKCTYSAGIVDPINVTTDLLGNVYVVDFNDLESPGYIDKFAQCKNKIGKQLSVNMGPEGIAVDAHGNLFVSFFNAAFNGGFEEFKKGQSSPTPLGATVTSPGGLVLDKNANLIADDQNGSIDLIAPPYSSATPLVTGLSDPFHVALNKSEKLLFNANNGNGTVTVYDYPSGALVTTLGTANGLDGAEGVSDSPNAVF